VRRDVVVDGLVAVDGGGEGSSVADLIALEIFVLERLEEALDDAVGLGRAVAGTDVGEFGPGGDAASTEQVCTIGSGLLWPAGHNEL
jgi:hypothetical protein